jgi:hypothetical protein
VKTKAYKLAAELGLQEQPLLDWLKANGYPNVRRADTIRAEVAVAARKALGRMSGAAGALRPAVPRATSRAEAMPMQGHGRDLRVSFAELLDTHLEQAPETRIDASEAPGDRADARLRRAEEERDAARTSADEWRVRFNRARSERDDLSAEVARLKDDAAAAPALRAARDRLEAESIRVGQALNSALDERSTLEFTCTELQAELSETRAAIAAVESQVQDQRQTGQELAAAVQREMAWRARALELERASLSGGALSSLLTRVGLSDIEAQAEVLRAVLAQREAAQALLRLLKPTDGEQCLRLLTERVRRVCVDPLCNQVAANHGHVALRVDAESECEVCQGSNERRWFLRMTQECERAGIRRLLLVGGLEGVQESVRALSQGLRVDFRLVSALEELVAPRIQGRVEGCDMLVLWGPEVVPEQVTSAYAQAARAQERPVAHVVGPRCTVYALSRAVTNRVTRNLVLKTL